jgi:rhodanese-related sulfurtransferase
VFNDARRCRRLLILLIIATLVFSAAFIAGCSHPDSMTSTASISAPAIQVVETTAADAFNLIQKNTPAADFVILDVRTPAEFSDGHISGAINIDFYASDFKDQLSRLDLNKRYLVYCRTGIRSAQAAGIMAGLGFQNIYNLTGGITAWLNAGYKVVK